MSFPTWRLYYEDGSTFDSDQGEPWESPELGICLVAQPGKDQDILATRDYVIYRTDVERWMETDIAGLYDQLMTNVRYINCFRLTRQLPITAEFRELLRAVTIEVRGR